MADTLEDLRIADILTFFAVQRVGSVTGAARELRVTPSQVSKAMTRLEAQLRTKLLTRSARRVTITDAGLRVLPQLEDVVSRLRQLRRTETKNRQLTVGGPSYLCNFFVPRIAEHRPHLRVRSIELPPALVRAYASDNFFDLALTLGVQPLPPSWISAPVGTVRKALFAAPALASRLGRPPVTPDKLCDFPFIAPIYNVGGQFVAGSDDCPLAAADRKLGHEVSTVALALELAARCEQLVFAPAIAARAYVKQKILAEVPVLGWDVREDLYLASNSDRVRADDQRAIVKLVTACLA